MEKEITIKISESEYKEAITNAAYEGANKALELYFKRTGETFVTKSEFSRRTGKGYKFLQSKIKSGEIIPKKEGILYTDMIKYL